MSLYCMEVPAATLFSRKEKLAALIDFFQKKQTIRELEEEYVEIFVCNSEWILSPEDCEIQALGDNEQFTIFNPVSGDTHAHAGDLEYWIERFGEYPFRDSSTEDRIKSVMAYFRLTHNEARHFLIPPRHIELTAANVCEAIRRLLRGCPYWTIWDK